VTGAVEDPVGTFFRVWLGESFFPRSAVAEQLAALGSLIEWPSANLLAVDAVDKGYAELVANYLAEQDREGRLLDETRLFPDHWLRDRWNGFA